MMRTRAWIGGFGFAVLCGSVVSLVACSGEDPIPGGNTGGTNTAHTGGNSGTTGGTTGTTGGTTGTTGGTTGTTGGTNTGTGGSGGAASACMSTKLTDALITDFEAPDSDTTSPAYNFGKAPTNWVGGTYTYPAGVTGTVTNGAWAISGKVDNYAGFGIWLGKDTQFDASNFTGIQFDISGTVGTDGKMAFKVGTGPTVWSGTTPDGSACFVGTATSMTQYSDCAIAGVSYSVTGTKMTVTVPWSMLVGGKSGGAAVTFDPAKLVKLQWEFTWPPVAAPAGTGGAGGGGASSGGAAGAATTGGAGGASSGGAGGASGGGAGGASSGGAGGASGGGAGGASGGGAGGATGGGAAGGGAGGASAGNAGSSTGGTSSAGATATGGAGGAAPVPYDINIIIDNIKFIGGPSGGMTGTGGSGGAATGGAAGAATGGAGGASTGGAATGGAGGASTGGAATGGAGGASTGGAATGGGGTGGQATGGSAGNGTGGN